MTDNMVYLVYMAFFLFVFLFGLCIGSFLNVVAWRLPNKISFVKGRSFCPNCQHRLAAKDLVPLFSYVALGGKCRYCKAKISKRYPLVELLCGCLFVWCTWELGFTYAAFVACVTAAILLTLSLVDYDTQTIPDSLIVALLVPCALSLFAEGPGLMSRIIGFFCVSVPLFLLAYFISGSIGFGDIELMAVCGFLLGWKNILLALFIGVILGGVFGLPVYIKLMRKKKSAEQLKIDEETLTEEEREQRKEEQHPHIPLGPALSAGIFLSLLYGERLIHWYLSFFMV